MRKPFKHRLARALADTELEAALDRSLPGLAARRRESLADQDFAAQQHELRDLRADHVQHMPGLLDEFVHNAEAADAVVHRAEDAAAAGAIVTRIARQAGATLAVKSKSMTTEEIDLGTHLEGAGVTTVETDLGEYIIQLAGEAPSHILVPALHKTREQMAELFREKTGKDVKSDRESLVAFARDELRQTFIDAGIGITGANLAIADTGTIVIVTNEGNDRLVSSLPPVHVVVVGIEKVVASLADAASVLPLLTRSATGQKTSTYVSYITGPSRSSDVEFTPTLGAHGPGEVHIVLVDNGRSAMRADPDFAVALRCIKCGACANVCPPYRIVGGHPFGYVYAGPIGLVVTPFHHGLENIAEAQSLCAGCSACATVCPVGIPLPDLINEVRGRANAQKSSGMKRRAIRAWQDGAGATRFAGRLLAGIAGRKGFLPNLPIPRLGTRWRRLPAPVRRTFAARTNDLAAGPASPGIPGVAVDATVAYFPGCITDRLYPAMGEAVVRVLRACGATVAFPDLPACCGLPSINAGEPDSAREPARRLIEALEQCAADHVLSSSSSCVVAMLQDYPRLLRDDPSWAARAAAVAARLVDFSGFMARVANIPAGALAGGAAEATITYHDACQTNHVLGTVDEQRRIITEVLGLNLVEMDDSDLCCGFGGSFSFDHPEIAGRLAQRKLDRAAGTSASIVVTDNPGCVMQLRGAGAARGEATEVLHLAELIARYLPD
ncbi:MAG: LUD domain-containing protein [Chloroflexota bacterium]|nr:LUD domain-containing protein [Chloroflexota bacterium]